MTAQAKPSSSPNNSGGASPFITFINENKRLLWGAFWLVVGVLFFLLIQERLASLKPSRLIQTTITGILVGGIYGLIALGIVIINKASGVFNFAHGHMMLIGSMIFYTFFSNASVNVLAAGLFATITVFIALTTSGFSELRNVRTLGTGVVAIIVCTLLMTLPNTAGSQVPQFVRAIVGGVMGAVLVGLTVERFTIRPLIGQPLFAVVLMTFAIFQLLQGTINLIWGSKPLSLSIFSGLQALGIPSPIRIDAQETLGGNIIIQTPLLIAFVLALGAYAVFVLFFRYTNVGLAMRASAENQTLAQSVGLKVRIILATAWAIAGILAMIAGMLQGGATSLDLNMPQLALRAFPAVLLGGLESISGALVGGLIIGLGQEWANLLFQGTNAGTELAPYLILMIVLVIRPQGLFGEKIIERI